MSSTFHILCLSHDPALDVTDLGYNTAEEAEAAVQVAEGHADCDLMLVRWSGAPIEYGCPGHGRSDELRRREHWCNTRHLHTEWIDDAWLSVLWTEQRLWRLRRELHLEAPTPPVDESADGTPEVVHPDATSLVTAPPMVGVLEIEAICAIASELFMAGRTQLERESGIRILQLLQRTPPPATPASVTPRYEDGIKPVDQFLHERTGRD